jgi:hypothetical protein
MASDVPKILDKVARQGRSQDLAGARAEASRRNGAKSRGPVTAAGKARSARNALQHGPRAQRFVLLDDEKPRQFEALADALADDLAPEGALQTLGLTLVRDRHGPRAFNTLLRYRGSSLAELWRSLRTLKALQAEAAAGAAIAMPNEPKSRRNAGSTEHHAGQP